MMQFYYDKDVKPIDVETFAKLCENLDYKIIVRTNVEDYLVSTVWLGINHNWGEGEPIIFETMVFFNKSADELYCKRYKTLNEAKIGHNIVAAKIRNDLKLGIAFGANYE